MSSAKISDTAPILSNDKASLFDINDGIAYLDLNSKLNIIDDATLEILDSALDEVETNYSGMVIGTKDDHFSVGLNLIQLLERAQNSNWDAISITVKNLQKVCTRLRNSSIPVVAATNGMALGGGCELVFGANAVSAFSNSQFGLVELRVGLIPCGGGTTEMAFRCLDGQQTSASNQKLFSHIIQTFETIRQAKVSKDAEEALQYRYLRHADQISTQRDNQLIDAKQLALTLWSSGYQSPQPQQIFVLGEEGINFIKQHLHNLHHTETINEYEQFLAEKLAYVFCGGMLSTSQYVSRQYLLDLEHEIFLGLCGEPRTHAMIESTLKKGKK